MRIPGTAVGSGSAELEPLGMDAGAFHLIAPPPPASNHPPLKEARSYPGFGGIGSGMCQLDDIDIPCDMAMTMMSSGSGVPCPPEGCGPQVRGGKLQPLTVDPKTGRLVYGHWESTNGGVERDPSTQEVIRTYPERPHFVADGVAVTTTFFVLNIGDASRERLTDHGTPQGREPKPPIDPCDIATPLPASGPGFIAKANSSASRQFGTGPTILGVMIFAEEWAQTHSGTPLRIGEISVQGGGKFGEHKGSAHASGLGVDIGLFRNDGLDQGTSYKDKAGYNRTLTGELAAALMKFPGVNRIFFNDPTITGSKLGRDTHGVHDNHIHVEFVNPCKRK